MKFSDEFAKLEGIVNRMEREKLSLEESLSLYEEGMQKARELQKYLDETEQKITELTKDGEKEFVVSDTGENEN